MILFNYCAYGYSFAHWSESDWDDYMLKMNKLFTMYPQKEGVTLLVVPGMELVWFNVLTKHYNYTEKEAEEFLCGPCYMPWFLMGNLYNAGGPITKKWIDRQARLGNHIIKKAKEYGWKVMLPGWNGMVPSNFYKKAGDQDMKAYSLGTWNGFDRPYMLQPAYKYIVYDDYKHDTYHYQYTIDAYYKQFAANYYKELEAVFGAPDKSQYYSIDLFHEGGYCPEQIEAARAWEYTFECLDDYNSTAVQVVQAWDWTDNQKLVLDNVPKGRLLVQDMQSDISPDFGAYGGHNAAFSVIPNFGGRTGVFGRILKTVSSYKNNKGKFSETSWIPEGCTSDFTSWNNAELYALAVLGSGVTINSDGDMFSRLYNIYKEFGCEFDESQTAELLRYAPVCSASSIQGPVEAIVCACPKLSQWQCSTWSSAFPQDTVKNALHFAALYIDKPKTWVKVNAGVFTMLKECVSQGLNIAAYKLLRKMQAEFNGNGILGDWNTLRGQWSGLMLDIETVQSLGADTDFTALVNSFYNIIETDYEESDEDVKAYEKDWLLRNNLKRQVTLWYDKTTAENGLGNYAYREYAGILSGFYLKRWEKYFDTVETAGVNYADNNIDWVQFAEDWINEKTWDAANKYDGASVSEKMSVLYDIFTKYFTVTYNEDGSVSEIRTDVASDTCGGLIPAANNDDQETVNEYKQYLKSITATLSDATTKETYGTASASLGMSDVNWYSVSPIKNRARETRNVSLDFNIKSYGTSNDSGLSLCCLFVYVKDNKTGKTIASRHWGQHKTSNNGFLNNLSDNITFAVSPHTGYSVFFRIESSWSDNINSDGTIKSTSEPISRPSVIIPVYSIDARDTERGAWSTDGTLSNAYYGATGCKYNIGKMHDACAGQKEREKAYNKLMWHFGRQKSCRYASRLTHPFYTGRKNPDGTDSYLVRELKKLFEIE